MTDTSDRAGPDGTPPERKAALSSDPSGVPTSGPIWQRFYMRGVLLTDLAVLAATSVIAQVWRFGTTNSGATANGPFHISYTTLGAAIVMMWWITLQIYRTRDIKILGSGPKEYARITRATVLVFGWLAILSLMFKWDMSRGFLAVAFPLGLAGLLVGRKFWRIWLRNARRHGQALSNVLVIGGPRSARDMAVWFNSHRESGLRVTGVWVPDATGTDNAWLENTDQLIPVMGTSSTLSGALSFADADTVIVTDTEHLGHRGLRELTWQLEGSDVDLLVSPNVVDVSGSRIHLRAMANMPFIQLEEPQYAEAGAWPKLAFDKVFALLALVAFSPFLVAATAAVKLSGPGPILFRQSRVGLNGDTFSILKFRSMREGAEIEQSALIAAQGTGDKPLFKVEDDPRITRVGAFLRRYSIDELPQLINVLRGDMSVVGPRPQQPSEVELYDAPAHRRLRVRPGMTGLWQVSGRSDLSWEDSIRLDTYYVENWSLTGDIAILWKTVRAVLRSYGAY